MVIITNKKSYHYVWFNPNEISFLYGVDIAVPDIVRTMYSTSAAVTGRFCALYFLSSQITVYIE